MLKWLPKFILIHANKSFFVFIQILLLISHSLELICFIFKLSSRFSTWFFFKLHLTIHLIRSILISQVLDSEMNRNVVNTCLDAISRAKKLTSFNMFITDSFETAPKEAELLKSKGGCFHLAWIYLFRFNYVLIV